METNTLVVADPNTFEGTLAILRNVDVAESRQVLLAPHSWLWVRADRVARRIHRGRRAIPFEDMFQMVLLRLTRSYRKIVEAIRRGTRADRAYLNGCIRNACRGAASAGRHATQEVPFSVLGQGCEIEGGFEAGIPDRCEAPDNQRDSDELLVRLRATIPELHPGDQSILWLYLKTGNMAEVARVTGKTYDEVRASWERSVERLRFLLREKSI